MARQTTLCSQLENLQQTHADWQDERVARQAAEAEVRRLREQLSRQER